MTGSTLRGRLAMTFVALAALIAVLVAGAVALAIRLTQDQSAVVDRLFVSYAAAAGLNQALLDQETGYRGFALTAREDFLEPYLAGRREQAGLQARLRAAEADYPLLRADRIAVARAVTAWRDQVATPGIAGVRAGGRLTPAQLQSGKQRFDAVRAAIADYSEAIAARRATKVRELRQDVRLLYLALGSGLLLLLVSAGLTWVALRRWVTQPLERLGAEVDRVEGGDLSRRVSVTGAPAEIAELAGQIDRMRSRILHEYALAEASRLEAVQAQSTIEAQAEDLRRSNAELEQFAYVASHDLQEPLRKVASFCQLIERRYKGQLDERGEQYIEFAVDGAKRMQQLINDLLAFSRVGRGGSDLVDVDLELVLAQAQRQLEIALADAGAAVTHDPLPTVPGDHSLLVQLFQNLIGNAVKFRGSDPPRVHLSARRSPTDPSVWELSCQDNGIGVEEQYQDKIFVIFQRLHGRDAYGGTGIGLAMCKKIVEHHGGRLWLDTTPRDEPGSVFRWTLPADTSSQPVTPSTKDNPSRTDPADEPGRGRHDAAVRS